MGSFDLINAILKVLGLSPQSTGMHVPFQRLVRFIGGDGKTYYGDAVLPEGVTDVSKATSARVITGSILPMTEPPSYTVTDKSVQIKSFLPPLTFSDCRMVRCLGLNYAKHAQESGMAIPTSPVLFYKPGTSLAGHGSTIPVPARIQSDPPGMDYEGEMVVIIGKPCLDVSPEEALDYVLGYAVGNDVSHRYWQLQKGSTQWSLGKGFDGWAPIGPGIVTKKVIEDPQNLTIRTIVNGETVQEDTTADMIFSVKDLISQLSIGTTLMPGDVIMTGT